MGQQASGEGHLLAISTVAAAVTGAVTDPSSSLACMVHPSTAPWHPLRAERRPSSAPATMSMSTALLIVMQVTNFPYDTP